jgi:hypothetical protein
MVLPLVTVLAVPSAYVKGWAMVVWSWELQ